MVGLSGIIALIFTRIPARHETRMNVLLAGYPLLLIIV
jgi:hypothetical protein